MFSKKITESDAFLDMPASTQNLYFHLSMNADDEGFVDKTKSIMRMIGARDDDMKMLICKAFVIPFESGVIVIKHWKMNNYLRKDRFTPTAYIEEKKQLIEKENGSYTLKSQNNLGIPTVDQTDTEYSIDKNRLDKNSIEYRVEEPPKEKAKRFVPPTLEEVKAYITEKNYNVDPVKFWNFYESKGWYVGKNKMKNWKSCVVTWNRTSSDHTGNSYQDKVNRQERNYTEEQFNNIASSFNDIDDLEL